MRAPVPGFRAAVCLNNAGVTMLERGCFRQGLETLQDAIAVMKDAFHGTAKASAGLAGSEDSAQSIEDKLLKASLRSLKPEVTVGRKRVNVHPLTYEGSGFSPEILRHLPESPTMTCFFPVRIDMAAVDWRREMAREGSDRPSEMDHEASILLYNFGVANLLLSEAAATTPGLLVPTSGDSLERLRACAVSVFQLSSSIISRCAQSCEDSVDEADLLQITLLVFHATIQVLVFGGNDDDALLVFDRYESVRRAVEALHSSPWYSIPKSIAAAA